MPVKKSGVKTNASKAKKTTVAPKITVVQEYHEKYSEFEEYAPETCKSTPQISFSKNSIRNQVLVPYLMNVYDDILATGAYVNDENIEEASVDVLCKAMNAEEIMNSDELLNRLLSFVNIGEEFVTEIRDFKIENKAVSNQVINDKDAGKSIVFRLTEDQSLDDFTYTLSIKRESEFQVKYHVLWVIGDNFSYSYDSTGNGYHYHYSDNKHKIDAITSFQTCKPLYVCLAIE